MSTNNICKKFNTMTDDTCFTENDVLETIKWLASNPPQNLIVQAFVSVASMSAEEILLGVERGLGQNRRLIDVGSWIAIFLSTQINILDPLALDALYTLCPWGSQKQNPMREDKLLFIFEQISGQDSNRSVPCIHDYFSKQPLMEMIAGEIISSAMDKALHSHDNLSFLMSILDCFIMMVENIFGEPREEKYNRLADIKNKFDEQKSSYYVTQDPTDKNALLVLAREFNTEAHRKRVSFFDAPALSGEVFDQYQEARDAFERPSLELL